MDSVSTGMSVVSSEKTQRSRKESRMTSMSIEELLFLVSKSSPAYRWLLTILLSFLTMKSSFDMFILNLATIEVPFYCNQIDIGNETFSWESQRALIEKSGENFSISDYTCLRPVFMFSNNTLVLSNSTSLPACTSWTFVPDDPDRWSMLMEYELVCDRQYLNNRFQTIFQAGIFVSSTLAPIGDIVGRRIPIVTAAYIDLTATILVSVVTDIHLQMVLRFLMSFGAPAVLTGIILLTEVIHEDYHGIHGNFYWVLWVVGYAGAGPVAYYIKSWRIQVITVAAIIGSGYVMFYFLVPESPRWLISRGRYKEAKKVLTKIFKRTRLDNDILNSLDPKIQEESDKKATASPLSIIPRENICQTRYLVAEFVFTVMLLANAVVYFATSFKRDFISRDPYINVIISGLLELPAYFIAWFLMWRCGRRFSNIVLLVSCGALLLILPYVPQAEEVLFGWKSLVALASKFIITISFSIVLIYASEALPTTIRTFSFCVSSQVMRLGQAITPELGGILGQVSAQFPYIIYGGMTILAGLLVFLLPETKDHPMPDTLAEMQHTPVPKWCLRKSKRAEEAEAEMQLNPEEAIA